MNLDTAGADSISAIREKERMYEEAMRSGDYLDGRFWADTWCAALACSAPRRLCWHIMEQMNYNLLFRWFVGLEMDKPVWNHAVFSKNRCRLPKSGVLRRHPQRRRF